MIRIILFCLLGQIGPAFLLWAEEKHRMRAALALKTLSSLFFVALGLALAGRCPDVRYARCILAGLILGMIGDILLNLCHLLKDSHRVFLLGGTVFFLGHILYLAALLPVLENPLLMCVAVPALLLPVLIFVFYRTSGEILFRTLMVLYLLTVAVMTAASLIFLWENPGLPRARAMAAGAELFLISDTMLTKNLLNQGRFRWMRFALMILYYLGQTLIALSLG